MVDAWKKCIQIMWHTRILRAKRTQVFIITKLKMVNLARNVIAIAQNRNT